MKQKLAAKLVTILMAFVMLFSLCSFGVAAATDTGTSTQATTQTTKKAKRPKYTDTLIEVEQKLRDIDEQLKPEEKNFWRDGIKELKKVESYDKAIAGAIGNVFEVIDDPQNADVTEIAMETVKSVVNIFASCYGLGGVSDALFDGFMNFGDNPQSEIQILQGHLDDQFDEVHNHLDEIQNDIAELSTQVDDSTKEILAALSDALEAEYAKTQVIAFMSSSDGNFNYTQFKNHLYGQTDGSENPYYYTQAYYNKLVESIVNNSSDDIIKENYDTLYRSLSSTAQHGDSNINMFYDYLLYNEQSGKESIQRYYYEYLLSNRELLGDRNAEFEALQFTLDLYTTALFADHCITMCNNYQLMCIYEMYGTTPSADAKYFYGSGENEYITYGQLLQNSAAIDARQAELEAQMVADVAYILNLEGSVVVEDSNHNTRVMDSSNEATFGCVQVNQTVYLNKMAEDWCDFFGFEANDFTYEWYSNNQYIGANDGTFTVNGFYTSFKGVIKYRGEEVYSVPFTIASTPTFNGGNGSAEDPYVISNAEQFKLISSTKDGLSKHYILINDIDFKDVSSVPIGDEDKPFNGSIDGNGYAIKNLEVTADEYVGLFAYVGPYGVIENLNVKGSTFKLGSNDFERVYAGAIAAVNEGTILNCYVEDSTISIDETNDLLNKHLYAYAGGIAGLSVGDISYCKVIDTKITAKLVRDYGSESDGKNSTTAYAAGVVAAIAENGTVKHCFVDNQTTVSAKAISTCHDSFSTRHPYITVRAAGIVVSYSDISKIDNVWSDAVIGKCEYDRENTANTGDTWTNNCSAKQDPYIPEITETQRTEIKANGQNSIVFPNQDLVYELTYTFDCEFSEEYNCYVDQLYACNDEVFKFENLNILINGEKADCSIIAYYNFDTFNSNVSGVKVNTVTIVFISQYGNETIVDRLQLPITITENTAIGLEVSVLPNRTTYDKDETVSIAGGSVVLRYQDGSTKDVTSSVELSYDTSKYGKTQVTVTYGGFSATYDILVDCPHSYQETTVEPTCTKIGYTVYTCEHCFDTYKTDFTEKTAHTIVEQNAVAATCTEAGKTADTFCTVCLQIIEFGEAIPATGHNLAAGRTDAGAHYCKDCSYGEEHLFRTTEYETEVLCTCVICDYTAKFDANSRDKISQLPRIVVSNAYSLNGENEIAVYLELYSNVGITSAHFSVYFGDELELVSYSYGNILYKADAAAFKEYSDHLNVILAQANTEMANPDYSASNTLLKLVFRTPENATAGMEYPILVVNKAEDKNGTTVFVDKFTSSTGEALDFIAVNGKIAVVDRLPGDVVGDGTIDLLDAVLISKYAVLEGADRTEFLAEMKALYESFDISYGDVNLDNLCTGADVVQILRYSVGGYEARILDKEFQIKLNYNDGTGKEEMISARYDENGKIILNNLPVVQREGYRFDGWYYGFGKDAVKCDGNYVWNYNAIEQTLYAHYTLNSISFVGNGATGGKMDTITSSQMDKWTAGSTFEKISNVYFGSGYDGGTNTDKTITHSFLGWALTANGEVVYAPGQVIDLKKGEIGNLTLYAVWSTKHVQLPELNREGYAHTEWTLQGSNVVIGKAGANYPVTEDISLSAKWSDSNLIKYTIQYNGNGATSGNTVDPSSRVHSVLTNWQVAPNGFVKTGYQFNGWNTKADGSGIAFGENAFITYVGAEVDAKNVVTLYAQWGKNTYDINFNLNVPTVVGTSNYTGKTSGTMSAMEGCLYDTNVTLKVNQFAIEGWIFKGWATSANGNVVYSNRAVLKNLGAQDFSGEKVNLYAVWEVDPSAVGKYVKTGAVVADTWDGGKTYTVYNTIDTTPRNNITSQNIIIDWSKADVLDVDSYGTKDHCDRTDHIDITPAVDELYLVGDASKEYLNLEFALCNFGAIDKLVIHFVDFKFVTRQATAFNVYPEMDQGAVITFDVMGDCSIRTSVTSGKIISGITNLTFTGDGTMNMTAGNGTDATTAGGHGSDGGTAIIVDNLTINMTGKITVVGGDGGNGYIGSTGSTGSTGSRRDWVGGKAGNGGTGGTGGTGGNGGAGGAAIIANKVIIVNGTAVCEGGDGGDGGKGGTGGTGGHGGCSNSWGTEGGDGGKGGTGGTGGNGRYGSIAVNCSDVTISSSGSLSQENGANGKVGAAGDGGAGGAPGYYDGAGWDSGEARKGDWGSTGDPGSSGSLV